MAQMRRLLRVVTTSVTVLWFGVGLAPGASAQANTGQEYLDQADELARGQGTAQVAPVLFPTLVRLVEPPIPMRTAADLRRVMLLGPDDPEWESVADWARQEEQQAVLDQLEEATLEDETWALGLELGRDAVDEDWVEVGLYVDLGEEQLLAFAEHRYLRHIAWVTGLASVQAELDARDDFGEEAMDVLLDAIRLNRIVMERPFVAEQTESAERLALLIERVADLVWVHGDVIGWEVVLDIANTLKPNEIAFHRLPLGDGDRLSVAQAIAVTFDEGGRPSASRIEALLESAQLRDQAAKLNLLGDAINVPVDHADAIASIDQSTEIFDQWYAMWEFLDNGPLLGFAGEDPLLRLDINRYAIVAGLLPDTHRLLELRSQLGNSFEGFRAALGIWSHRDRFGLLPHHIRSVTPKLVEGLSRDVFHLNDAQGRYEHFRYWVPIRDQPRQRRQHPPYTLTVAPQPMDRPEMPTLPDLVERAETDQLTIGEEYFLYLYMYDLVFWLRGAIPTDLLYRIAAAIGRNDGDIVTIDPEQIDERSLEQALEDIAEEEAGGGERRGRREGISFRRLVELNRLAFFRSRDRGEIHELMRRQFLEWDRLDLPSDSEEMGSLLDRLFGWYGDTDAGNALDSGLDQLSLNDFAMIAKALMAGPLENEQFVAMYDEVRNGGELTEQDAVDANVIVSAELIELEIIRRLFYVVQFGSELTLWLDWEPQARSWGSILAGRGIDEYGGFQYQLDNRDSIEHFMVWSTGPDGLDERGQFVGPGGSDDLFWPPPMSLERERR
ncbi:MAG: hypothetical protein AAGI30_01250 [Planctomycetota bacterium]